VASRIASGIRKAKPKTPKAASWKISRKDLCMSHGKGGKLHISGGGKAKKSGLNTPRGIVPVDPTKPSPFEAGLSLITQHLSSVEQTNALLSATGSLSGPLFSADRQAETMVEMGISASSQFYPEPFPTDEDMTRFVDFPAEGH
jgi:hypothetical protein